MPDRGEIAEDARRLLGRGMASVGWREWGLLERLLHPGEPIEAMAYGMLRGRWVGGQRLLVATPLRLLVVAKGFFTGREEVCELAWDGINDVAVVLPWRLTLALPGERIELTFVQPSRQLAAIADRVRARLDPTRATVTTAEEVLDQGRRKLGRMTASALEANLIALAELLEPGETVLELVFVTSGERTGLLAASTTRLVFVPSRGLGVGEAVEHPYPSIAACELTDDEAMVVRATGGAELRIEAANPVERALSVAEITRARMAGR